MHACTLFFSFNECDYKIASLPAWCLFQSEISGKTISEIKDHLLTPLQNLRKLKNEGQLMADLWCHFGKVLVSSVDEGNNKFEEYS